MKHVIYCCAPVSHVRRKSPPQTCISSATCQRLHVPSASAHSTLQRANPHLSIHILFWKKYMKNPVQLHWHLVSEKQIHWWLTSHVTMRKYQMSSRLPTLLLSAPHLAYNSAGIVKLRTHQDIQTGRMYTRSVHSHTAQITEKSRDNRIKQSCLMLNLHIGFQKAASGCLVEA